jgi:uncharacterized protein
MMQELALINGGNDGIGLATSIALLNKGYKVIVIDKNISNIQRGSNDNKDVYIFKCDVCKDDDIKKTFLKIREIADSIDILINSAGIGAFGDFDKQNINVFKNVMDINFFGTVRIIKACLPSMLEKKKGHIINISSISGKVSFPGSSPYCCSNWALEGFSESLRIEVKNQNINVSVINPGNVRTNFHKHVLSSEGRNDDNLKPAGMPVDYLVRKIIQTIDKPKRDVYVPWRIELAAICEGIFPSFMDHFYFKCARKKNMHLDNTKVAIVTGASSGIGKAIASDLCAKGLTVIMIARNKDKLFTAAKEMADLGGNPVPIPCDVSDHETVRQTIDKIMMDFGKIDILINNAGYSVRGKIENVPIEEYISNMGTNFYGSIQIVKEVLPVMERECKGHILSVLSTNAIRGLPYLSSYGATKFALRSFSRCLDREMSRRHIDINFSEIFPARVDTPFLVKDFSSVGKMNATVGWSSSEGKNLSAEEVAKCVLELLETRKTRKFVPLKSYLLLVGNTLAPSIVDLYLSRVRNTEVKY